MELLRCLVVDDEELERELIAQYLEGVAACDMATDGGEAVAKFQASLETDSRYDLIILGHESTTNTKAGTGNRDVQSGAMAQLQDLTNSRLRPMAQQQMAMGETLVVRNLGYRARPIIRLNFVERDDPQSLSTVALNLKNAGAGEDVDRRDLIKRCALRVAENGAPTLGPATGGADTPPPPPQTMSRQELAAIDREFQRLLSGQLDQAKKRALAFGRDRMRGRR